MSKNNRISDARERLLSGIGVPEPAPFEVDPFQQEAIDSLGAGHDTLVVAPTGSGKTFIAIEAMRAAIKNGARVVYTTPLKALSNTKYAEFQHIFGPEFSVGLLTGDRKIEGDAHIVIATTEIYRNELYRSSDRYALVVLDEVHYIADPQRGAVWEECIILTPSSTTLLMLSASISNSDEIAEWVGETRNKDCRIVSKKDRPVELRYGFIHPRFGVVPLDDENGSLEPIVSEYYQNLRFERAAGRRGGGGGGRHSEGGERSGGHRRGGGGGGRRGGKRPSNSRGRGSR